MLYYCLILNYKLIVICKQIDEILILLLLMLLESEEKICGWQAVAGIINGMVGSLILGLPVLALYGGYASSFIMIIITGLFCAFSSWIYFQHLGEEPDIGHALKKHFKNNIFKIIYDSFAFIFLIIACIDYFQLIVIQWEIIFPKTTQGWYHVYNVIGNSIMILSFVILLKYIGYGAITMVYGLFSICIYLFYLVYVLATQDQSSQVITPAVPFGQQTFTLAGAMAEGFMIQVFLVPFLQKVKDQENKYCNSVKYTFLAYLLGGIVYQVIALVGSFGITHRVAYWDFNVYGILAFQRSSWEVDFICVVYILHLYSVLPQFLLIAKRLLFQNLQRFGLRQTAKGINLQQIIYFCVVVIISAILAVVDISTNYLLMVNGGIFGAIIIYLIPVCLHIYCMFFIPQWRRSPFGSPARGSQIQIGHFGKSQSKNSQSLFSSKSEQNINEKLISGDNIRVEDCFVNCQCQHYKLPKKKKIMITALLLLLPATGILVFVESVLAIYD